MTELATDSPRIHRCALCGALVHPGDPEVRAAWCGRCGRAVPVALDGGAARPLAGPLSRAPSGCR